MPQATLDKTTPKTQFKESELRNLKTKVQLLHSLIISLLGEDKEGKYEPRFVREILKAVKEKPVYSFRNAEAFLKELR